MSQLTFQQFNTLVLEALGAPITQNNLNKLNAIGVQEGTHGTFNIMNWVLKAAGSSNYNSAGVQNYQNPAVGVQMTVQGLNQSNTAALKRNLVSDGPYNEFIMATNQFYQSWGGGTINVSEANAGQANTRLLEGNASDTDIANAQKVAQEFATGQHPSNDQVGNPLPGILNGITGGIGDAAGAAANATGIPQVVNALSSVPQALSTFWGAITNVQNWYNILKVVGGGLLVIFGLYLLAVSLNAAPAPNSVIKKAAF